MRRFALLLALGMMLAGSPGGAHQWPNDPAISGPAPGPAMLYAGAATTPELSNGPGWNAAPLMVSGAEAYVDGEYLYQDYIYDSYGANTTDAPMAQPDTVPASSDTLFGGATGDVVYPTDASRFANNAADLLEFRARLQDGKAVYRVTLNTVVDSTVAAVAIGIDTGPGGADDWGYGIGSLGDLNLEHVVVVRGFDTVTNQAEIATSLEPEGATWNHYLVTGLWNDATQTFTAIGERPTATAPGGAQGTSPPPVFNVGFRLATDDDEPAVEGNLAGLAANPAGQLGSRTVGAGHWREHAQALALAERDISAFAAQIDFVKIEAGGTDTSRVPRTGFLSRLYVSRLSLGEGAQPDRPMLKGKIQPYGLFVPSSYSELADTPLVLALHSLSCSYNQFAVFAPNLYRDLGEERGALVLTPEGRGPDGWYHDEAEVDLFEAWADVRRLYRVDDRRVAVNGYSMGGYGTLRLASTYPDLFNAAFGVVAPADENLAGAPSGGAIDDHGTMDLYRSLEHVPMMLWYGVLDELVPVAGTAQVAARLVDAGVQHEVSFFPGADHFALSLIDEWDRGKQWIERPPVDPDPNVVRFVAKPALDNAALGLVHDHAYWVSDVRVRSDATTGYVDARSRARGYGDAMMGPYAAAGADPAAYAGEGLVRIGYEPTTAQDVMDLELDDVESVTLWVERAGLSSTFELRGSTDGPSTVTVRGSFGSRVVSLPAGAFSVTVTI